MLNPIHSVLLLMLIYLTFQKYKRLSLVDVGALLQYLIGDFYIPMYLKDSEYKSLDPDYIIDGVSSQVDHAKKLKQGIYELTKLAGNIAPAKLGLYLHV